MRINITKFDDNSYYSQVGIPTTRQERNIALGYYITGRWRKWAMLRKHIPWLNPVGFHNWTQEEYSQHLDYLDSLIGDV